MPKIYKLQKLNPTAPIWRHFPHAENHAYWVGEDEKSARMNAAVGSTPKGKLFTKSPWMDSEITSCVLDYDSSEEGVSGVEGSR
jgi:hypothetical protein